MKKYAFLAIAAAALVAALNGSALAQDNVQDGVGICADSYCGDTNNDGITVTTDALAVLRIAVGLDVPAPFCDFTVCEGEHCVTDTLPISSFTYEPGAPACFVGPPTE